MLPSMSLSAQLVACLFVSLKMVSTSGFLFLLCSLTIVSRIFALHCLFVQPYFVTQKIRPKVAASAVLLSFY